MALGHIWFERQVKGQGTAGVCALVGVLQSAELSKHRHLVDDITICTYPSISVSHACKHDVMPCTHTCVHAYTQACMHTYLPRMHTSMHTHARTQHQVLGWHVLNHWDLLTIFRIDAGVAAAWLQFVEACYTRTEYHNSERSC